LKTLKVRCAVKMRDKRSKIVFMGFSGLTGAGKTTLIDCLARRIEKSILSSLALVLDLDKFAHALYDFQKVKEALLKTFGTCKRKEIARVVFSSGGRTARISRAELDNLQKLNAIFDPYFERLFKALRKIDVLINDNKLEVDELARYLLKNSLNSKEVDAIVDKFEFLQLYPTKIEGCGEGLSVYVIVDGYRTVDFAEIFDLLFFAVVDGREQVLRLEKRDIGNWLDRLQVQRGEFENKVVNSKNVFLIDSSNSLQAAEWAFSLLNLLRTEI